MYFEPLQMEANLIMVSKLGDAFFLNSVCKYYIDFFLLFYLFLKNICSF